ncbi:hypothetical protein RINTHH_9720 [Richelia intracellularis HH01]|uniref:Uncharacterized protein n=1 Tax=Richelia intracellularis HH01 TaxID=1165094 RepID=M1WYY3_9NOST|nr:hypothetical protein [Richelia intracellularis]CCH67127.1 hypothetical protein RINTHH_9720 [Richelia intracellularis HH01]
MKLEFVPVDKFYFAITLAVRTLEYLEYPGLVDSTRSELFREYGQPSTVAPGKQNTFNYVFSVLGVDNSPSSQLIVSISDWQNKLRLSSDYGWVLNSEYKPIRTEKFNQRTHFSQSLQSYIQKDLQICMKDLNLKL